MLYFETKINNPLSFISCGQFISPGDWVHSKRTINSFEIIIGVEGVLHLQQEEEKYEVRPGNVLHLYPSYCHKGYAPSNTRTSFYWLHYVCRNPYSIFGEEELGAPASYRDSIIIPTYSTPPSIEKIIIQFKQLLHITTSKYYTPYSADYLLSSMLIELTQQTMFNSFGSAPASEMDNRLTAMLEWLRINIQKDISIDEIAHEFKFNKDYMSRLFKKHTGTSIKNYINSMKVSKAKELLCRSDMNIKEIAYWLGFNDEKYFMRLFKEYEHLTPSAYRNAYYNTHLNNS